MKVDGPSRKRRSTEPDGTPVYPAIGKLVQAALRRQGLRPGKASARPSPRTEERPRNPGAERARARREELEALWREAVGEEIAARTHLGQVRRGVLTVEVESAPLLAELVAYRRAELRDFLRDRYTREPIADLRFRRRRN